MSSPGQHHELLMKVAPWSGYVSKGIEVDFLGVKTRSSYSTRIMPVQSDGQSTSSLPPFDEEYLEWVDLFESIASAKACFTMIELGAGYGRWLVRAAFAVRWFGNIPCKLVGVEAEPTHFEWMKQHFSDNGIGLEDHKLVRAAVSRKDGGTWFIVGAAGEWYGQRSVLLEDFWQFAKQRLRKSPKKREGERRNTQTKEPPMYHLQRVKAVSLRSLLRPLKQVDLIDLDVQGAELEVLTAASPDLEEKVKRVHIGTHNHEVESGLRSLFGGLGWRCRFDFPLQSTCETSWGAIRFDDGVQSWINPRFLDPS